MGIELLVNHIYSEIKRCPNSAAQLVRILATKVLENATESYSDTDSRRVEQFLSEYSPDDIDKPISALLTAKHPRRVSRLFEEQKDTLNATFHRDFSNRDEFIAYVQTFREAQKLHESLGRFLQEWKVFRSFRDALPPDVDKLEIDDLFYEPILIHRIGDVLSNTISVWGLAYEPQLFYGEKVKDEFGRNNYPNQGCFDLLRYRDLIRDFDRDTRFTSIDAVQSIALQRSEITGAKSIDDYFTIYFDQSGSVTSEEREVAREKLHKAYRRKEHDFLTLFNPVIDECIHGWQQIANEFEYIAHFHTPHKRVRKRIEDIIGILDGRSLDDNDDRPWQGFPGILQRLIADDIVPSHSVNPHIDENFLLPGRVRVKSVTSEQLDALPLRTFLPRSTLAYDKDGLANLFHQDYFSAQIGAIGDIDVLYSSDEALIVRNKYSSECFHIHVDSDTSDFVVGDLPYTCRKISSPSDRLVQEALVDPFTPLKPFSTYTIFPEMSDVDFSKEFGEEFLAYIHAIRGRALGGRDSKSYARSIKRLAEEQKLPSIEWSFGSLGYATLSTYCLQGRTAISIHTYHDEVRVSAVVASAVAVADFFEARRIPFREEYGYSNKLLSHYEEIQKSKLDSDQDKTERDVKKRLGLHIQKRSLTESLLAIVTSADIVLEDVGATEVNGYCVSGEFHIQGAEPTRYSSSIYALKKLYEDFENAHHDENLLAVLDLASSPVRLFENKNYQNPLFHFSGAMQSAYDYERVHIDRSFEPEDLEDDPDLRQCVIESYFSMVKQELAQEDVDCKVRNLNNIHGVEKSMSFWTRQVLAMDISYLSGADIFENVFDYAPSGLRFNLIE